MIEKLEMNMKKQDIGSWKDGRNRSYCNIEDMVGKKVVGIYYDEENFQILTDGCVYIFHHQQDCCESVYLTQVDGISDKIIGSRIVMAEEVVDEKDTEYGHITWTFYKIGTTKGIIDFRFQGESNGYYSESADLIKIEV